MNKIIIKILNIFLLLIVLVFIYLIYSFSVYKDSWKEKPILLDLDRVLYFKLVSFAGTILSIIIILLSIYLLNKSKFFSIVFMIISLFNLALFLVKILSLK